MRLASLILIVVGVLALTVHSITYFSTDTQVGPLGFFAWDVAHPHTIFFNPIAGIISLAVGICLIMMVRRRPTGSPL